MGREDGKGGSTKRVRLGIYVSFFIIQQIKRNDLFVTSFSNELM